MSASSQRAVEVLHQVGPLDEADELELRAHPAVGGDLLLAVSPALAPIAAAVRAHHERWDGSGYPDGLKGDQIPLLGRIIAVASKLDSLTRPRPYGPGAMGAAGAIDELRRWSGRKFDPMIVPLVVELCNNGRVVDATGVLLSVQHLPEAVRFPQLSTLSARQWEVLSHLMPRRARTNDRRQALCQREHGAQPPVCHLRTVWRAFPGGPAGPLVGGR